MTDLVVRPPAPDLPTVHRTEVDGVPVFWHDQPGELTANLVFGVGLAHENFLQSGLTHITRHLAMWPLPPARHDSNTAVEMLHTTFDVTADPQVVVEHLRRVCASLGALDTSRLDVERAVLSAEERAGDGPGVASWLPGSIWFGNRSYGLAANIRVATVRASADEVRAWCARWFHRRNAALVLSGPPPQGLRLPLPDGPPARPPAVPPFNLITPARTTVPNGVLACALVDWTAAMACATGTLVTRLTDRLRRKEGMVHDFAFRHQPISATRALLGFGTDVPDSRAGRVLEAIREELAELGESGPTAEELTADRDQLAAQLAGRRFAEYRAFDEALSALTGWASSAEHQRQVLAGLEAEAVAAAAKDLAKRLVLCGPAGQTPDDLPSLPGSALPPVHGRELKRAMIGSTAPREFRLTVNDEGLTSFHGAGPVPLAVVRFDDLAGVGVEHTDGRLPILHLFGLHGGMITVRPGDWRGGRTLVRELLSRIDESVCFEAPDSLRLFAES